MGFCLKLKHSCMDISGAILYRKLRVKLRIEKSQIILFFHQYTQ